MSEWALFHMFLIVSIAIISVTILSRNRYIQDFVFQGSVHFQGKELSFARKISLCKVLSFPPL